MNRMTRFAMIGLLIAAPAWAERKVDEVRPLAADGSVGVSNFAGSVQVVGWSSDQVEITGVLGRNVRELEIGGDANRLQIEVDVPRHADDLGTELVIKVPMSASVDVETVSATIDIEGVSGQVSLESVSGRITVSGTPSELSVESVSSDITVGHASRETDLESVSGSIVIHDGAGELAAATVSGNVSVLGGAFDAAGFESVSGNIGYSAQMSPRGEYDFETVSGTVKLVVQPSVSAEFYVETFSGSIQHAIGPEARSTNQYTPEKELSFTAGAGGAEVSISTFSGGVQIATE
jgi:DUF4097 and DUF4098 domain-containing protein YvlB